MLPGSPLPSRSTAPSQKSGYTASSSQVEDPTCKQLAGGGSHPWIGLANLWDILYLFTMDVRMSELLFGNADLAGRMPWHLREADHSAGSGHYFDAPDSGSVDTFGRVVSVNARKTVSLGQLDLPTTDCGSEYAPDKINTLTFAYDGWDFYSLGRHHMPDVAYLAYLLSGRYYYLEELQMEAAYFIGWRPGCYGPFWMRQGDAGYFNDGEPRADAWSFRTTAYAAFLSPDGSPEKSYFEDKLLNNIAKEEGRHDLALSVPSKNTHWTWGKNNPSWQTGPSPLGMWDSGSPAYVGSPIRTDGSVLQATAPWQYHFILISLGVARDFGYPTDTLLRYMGKSVFNLLLNPATKPYLIESYVLPTILASSNDWIQSWIDFNSHFSTIPSSWQTGQDVDHGYGFIALAATSFLYPYSVDGYDGSQAWDLFRAVKPELNRFGTESPKWDILPRTGAPAPPRNLIIKYLTALEVCFLWK